MHDDTQWCAQADGMAAAAAAAVLLRQRQCCCARITRLRSGRRAQQQSLRGPPTRVQLWSRHFAQPPARCATATEHPRVPQLVRKGCNPQALPRPVHCMMWPHLICYHGMVETTACSAQPARHSVPLGECLYGCIGEPTVPKYTLRFGLVHHSTSGLVCLSSEHRKPSVCAQQRTAAGGAANSVSPVGAESGGAGGRRHRMAGV